MKTEFALSFNSNKRNKIRDFTFEYRYNSMLSEHYLLYQREHIIISIEHFKDLVALFKKAAKSFSLIDIFLTHVEPMNIHEYMLKIKMSKPINLIPINNFIHKQEISDIKFLYSVFEGYNIQGFGKLNIYSNELFRQNLYNSVNFYENVNIDRINDDILIKFENISIPYIYYMDIFKGYDNLSRDIFLGIFDDIPSLYNNNFIHHISLFDIFMAHRTNYLYIYNDYLSLYRKNFIKDINLYIRSFMYHEYTIKDISLYENNYAIKIFPGMSLNEQVYIYKNSAYDIPEPIVEMAFKDNYIINLYENNNVKSNVKINNLIENNMLLPNDNHLHIYDSFNNMHSNDNILNLFSITNTEKVFNGSSLSLYNDIEQGKLRDMIMSLYENPHARLIDLILRYDEFIDSAITYDQSLYINSLDMASIPKIYLGIFNIDSFNIIDKTAYIYNNDAVNRTIGIYNIYNRTESHAIMLKNQLSSYDKDDFTNHDYKYLNLHDNELLSKIIPSIYTHNTVFVDKFINGTNLYIYNIFQLNKIYSKINVFNNNNFLNISYKYIFINNYESNLLKTYFELYQYKYNYVEKTSSMLRVYDIMSLHKTYSFLKLGNILYNFQKYHYMMKIYNDIKSSNLYIKPINFVNSMYTLYKSNQEIGSMNIFKLDKVYYNLNRYHSEIKLNKISSYIYKASDGYSLFKNKYFIDIYSKINNLKIYNKPFKLLFDKMFLSKKEHGLYNIYTFNGLFKESYPLYFEETYIYEIFKIALPLMLLDIDVNGIITISKVDKTLFQHNLNDFLFKELKSSDYIDLYSVTASKVSFRSRFFDDLLLCDKSSKNTDFIDMFNESVIKNRVNTWFVKNSFDSISKIYFKTSTLNNFILNKISMDIFIENAIDIYKITRNTRIIDRNNLLYKNKISTNINRDSIDVQKDIPVEYLDSQEWFNTYRLGFYHNTGETVFRILHEVFKNKDIIVDPMQRQTSKANQQEYADHLREVNYIDNNIFSALRNNYQSYFYDNYILDKSIALGKFPMIDEVSKCIKDSKMSTSTIIDFAWVYEDDDDFDDPFKIDELLLPENDTKYEDFEDIIFNRDTLAPRNPVKVIDDFTFIAKFPNHYPIKDTDGKNAYQDVALKYLPVHTSIMRQVFIGYYKLWQDNVFDFAKMTIPQSAKKILDYLYIWIFMYFPEEDIPEALRSFKLIRWYLERSIIECSEYIVSYNPSDLKSGKMNTTVLPIPNDMTPLEQYEEYMDPDLPNPNNSMVVDTTLHVIKNNLLRLRREAHVTFFIENKKETTISFDLNTFTPVSIILNGDVIDTISLPTTGKMVYNIPYTEDVNVFTIKKQAIDNIDNYFYIGNIVIPGMGKDGDLDISFNPKIQGNKVLNHTSKKILSYMNLYEDNAKLLTELVEGNVHLNDVYNHLLEYWDLHHQEKTKGKRWTIKRT